MDIGTLCSRSLRLIVVSALVAAAPEALSQAAPGARTRVAIVGLVHGHVQGFLHSLPAHSEVELVGIAEPDAALRAKYIESTHLAPSLFFASEKQMLAATHPQAILVYTAIAGHRAAVEGAAPLGIATMVEKPLATTVPDALRIQQLSLQYHVPVLTNYETTWYASNTAAIEALHAGKLGDLRRVVVHDGHKGPKEIGVDPEFLTWLTDPEQNGAGALFDFGCYGVDLTMVLMHGELPLSVTAVTGHDKPAIYPHVDDDSTVLLQYPHAVADIEGSWNWPFDRKDMEVYGATGYIDTVYVSTAVTDHLRERLAGEPAEHAETAPALAAPHDGSLNYLVAVLNGSLRPEHDLSSLETNVAVVRILDAARRSAASGRTVMLDRRP